jgi:hypothetical protein
MDISIHPLLIYKFSLHAILKLMLGEGL